MKAFSPTGQEIIATADLIPGNAMCEFFGREADGSLKMDHTNEGTRVCWDGAITKTDERGLTLYVAADGTEWPEDAISLEGEALRPMPTAPAEEPWRAVLRELLEAGNNEALYEHDDDEHRKALDRMSDATEAARRLLNAFPAPAAPSSDWCAIAANLAGALSSTVDQINQMKGMFGDEDGAIRQALGDAEAASDRYSAARKIAPEAPAPAMRKVWTVTTDSDECELTTKVFPSEAAAIEDMRDRLEDEAEGVEQMDAEQLSDLWQNANEGACIIESHDIPA